MKEILTTIMDMLHDAYHGASAANPPHTPVTKRVLYSAVRRKATVEEFQQYLAEIVECGRAEYVDEYSLRWIEK